MRVTERRQRLRALLTGERCIAAASVFDPLSARMAEDLGFEAGLLAGSVASLAVTGAPDLMGMTLSEFAQQVHRICRAGDLSLIADADDGFGNALNVMRTVEELETAGAAALVLEDTLLPLPFGRPDADQLVSLEEGVGKMRAALAARSDPDLVIVGRTNAAKSAGLGEAIQRLAAYSEAGVDAVFPVGVKTPEALAAIRDAVAAPLFHFTDGKAPADLDALAALGVRIVFQGHAPFAAAMQAAADALAALKGGRAPAGRPAADLLRRLSRRADYQRRIAAYLK